ncbi:nucleolin 1 isoform X1 [Senna tora]|uniref:Nucleolin 1 isoform X1 n=1 Tax=Senna tora TaxID=362788 RepID=A0A834SSM7_9FABA|nr:nucleolin 1 isoform X1 [Senna tora]
MAADDTAGSFVTSNVTATNDSWTDATPVLITGHKLNGHNAVTAMVSDPTSAHVAQSDRCEPIQQSQNTRDSLEPIQQSQNTQDKIFGIVYTRWQETQEKETTPMMQIHDSLPSPTEPESTSEGLNLPIALRKGVSEESKEAPHKNVKDEEMVDAPSTEETEKEPPKMAATLKEQNASSKKIFVGNLPYRVPRIDLENLFEDCGEIVKLNLATEHDGRFRGFGHVEFATEEAAQKALKLNGSVLCRRSIRIEKAREKGAYSPNTRNESLKGFYTSFGDECKSSATLKEQNTTSKTLYVGNLSFSVEKTDLEILFKDCGEIVDIRLATDREGRFKGFGHVEFATEEAAQNGLKFDGYELLRRSIRLDLAPEKTAYSSNRSNSNDSSQTVGGIHSQTIFVKGFDTSLGEDKIKTSLKEHFSSCGMISGISIAREYDSGAAKGFIRLHLGVSWDTLAIRRDMGVTLRISIDIWYRLILSFSEKTQFFSSPPISIGLEEEDE